MVGMGYDHVSGSYMGKRTQMRRTDWEYAYEPEISSEVWGIVNYVSTCLSYWML
jgi:hypothetical protein